MRCFFDIQRNLKIEPPLFVSLSIIEVKDYIMGYNWGFGREFGHSIDKDTLIIPEVMIESFDIDLFQIMKPIFDTVWNAAGYPRSLNYY